MNARAIAEHLLAEVSWTDPDMGYCRCPGIDLHTSSNGRRDCKVMLNGAPTIYCVHTSCSGVVADANRKLRSAIGKAERGTPHPRPLSPGSGEGGVGRSPEEIERRRQAERQRRLDERSRRSFEQIIAKYLTGLADVFESSPVRLLDGPRDDWRLLLCLFPADGVVWIGDTMDSCDDTAEEERKVYCRTHFRPVRSWLAEKRAPGQFTCPSLFKPGVHSRSNANVASRPFLVVESDSLGKEDMMAVFLWMGNFMRMRAVVDTAGKSLHGWFEFPDAVAMAELRVILPALGLDPALFRESQPCRLPGAMRGEKTQSLLWLDLEGCP